MSAQDSHFRAILLSLGCFTLLVVSDAMFKLIGEYKLPVYEIVGFHGVLSCLVILLVCFRGGVNRLRPKKPVPIILRSVMLAVQTMCNFIALPHLSLSSFYVTVFTAPLLMSLAAAMFLREPLSWQMLLAIIIGFCGVVFALDPASIIALSGDYIGYAAASFGVLLFVASQLILRRVSQSETPESIMFAAFAACGLSGMILTIWNFEPMPMLAIGYLIIEVGANLLGCLCMVWAMRMATAATVSSFHYSQLITGSILGYLIWHDTVSWHLVVGALVIVASGLYVVHLSRRPLGSEHDVTEAI